jgi:hypothetical protein
METHKKNLNAVEVKSFAARRIRPEFVVRIINRIVSRPWRSLCPEAFGLSFLPSLLYQSVSGRLGS